MILFLFLDFHFFQIETKMDIMENLAPMKNWDFSELWFLQNFICEPNSEDSVSKKISSEISNLIKDYKHSSENSRRFWIWKSIFIFMYAACNWLEFQLRIFDTVKNFCFSLNVEISTNNPQITFKRSREARKSCRY